jgi:hypothetical protein
MRWAIYWGIRASWAVHQITPMLLALDMRPVNRTVTIPFAVNHIDDGVFAPTEKLASMGERMLDSVRPGEAALRHLRLPAGTAR